jgi:ribosomal protein L3
MTNGGILCIKQDMTSLLLENKMEAVTLLKFLDQEIIRLKTEEKDGYNAVVIGAVKKEKDGKVSYRYIKEFKVDTLE